MTNSEIAKYEARSSRKTTRTWLRDHSDLLPQIQSYLEGGGTLAAVHRWLTADKGFPYSVQRLDAVLFDFIPRPQRW